MIVAGVGESDSLNRLTVIIQQVFVNVRHFLLNPKQFLKFDQLVFKGI